MRAVITVIGKDMVGILARVSSICAENNVNGGNHPVHPARLVCHDYDGGHFQVFDPVPGSGGCAHRDWGRDGLTIHVMHEDIFNSMHRI